MRLLKVLLIAGLICSVPLFARGGGGGGGHGGGGGGARAGGGGGGGFRGASVGGGAFRGGAGVGGAYRGGYGGGRYGGYGYGGRFYGGFGLGFGLGFGWPYYGYGWPYYGYGGYYGYPYYDPYYSDPYYIDPYAYGDGYPGAGYPGGGYAPQYVQQPAQPVVVNQNVAARPAQPAQSYYQAPDFYLIAFNDHTIRAALSFRVEGGQIHWTSREHEEHDAPLSTVDQRFSEQINRDRHVEFRLP